MAENILDAIGELRSRGLTDAQTVAQLENFGFTRQEINDAISQMQAKAAVVETEGDDVMQPSILQPGDNNTEELPVPKPIAKKTKRRTERVKEYPPVQEAQPAYPYAHKEQTPNYAGSIYPEMPAPAYPAASMPTGSADIETMEEITEEIVAEKFSEISSKISDVLDFKEIIETKITNLDHRLKRMESSIDRMQLALLGKVQEYSKDIKTLGSGMRALEGAFGKILNPLVDNVKELDRITEKIKRKKSR